MDTINGINVSALAACVEQVKADASTGIVKFSVETDWKGGTQSVAKVSGWQMGGKPIAKNFEIVADEPLELLGKNEAPNPQELLLAALNACLMVGYAATAAVFGVQLSKLQIKASGELDLRGFLGIDESVKPGYDEVDYEVIIEGNGTPEQFQKIHETVMKTSPNLWNVANSIYIKPKLTCRGMDRAV